jgi:N-acetylglucosaminyldiphosphoundecaprenol N-acetyl-beta-D-mannosaminyltransferase
VYFLGATEEVLARFLEVVAERYPRLVVAGAHNGYFDDDAAIAESIARAGARFLFVAMPSPRKELFVSANLCRVGPLLAMGVGGSFDVWAGKVSRAPRWMRSAGLEWLHRLISEPRKMWRRNVVGSSRFAAMVLAERFRPR